MSVGVVVTTLNRSSPPRLHSRSDAGLSVRPPVPSTVQVGCAALICSFHRPFDFTVALGPSTAACAAVAGEASTVVDPLTPSRIMGPTRTCTVVHARHALVEHD